MNCRCGQPVDETKPHVSYVRNVEVLKRNAITVSDSEEIEQRHLSCD